ncbi:MAG: DNA topoisomerase I, bacterial [Parcubacteria group bacterium Athens0714_26]|nr:MAG: DNA topoisomerase I, bacterial [Parcubacteria group bacterium Athens1014_26]TSD02666.1 MAG: DNA topoisomerase I, bacterial [Parcubacteria group bacterium Athens0714_26]
MKLVIVESPTKAKTISNFIKDGYKVESSFGHIRDLPRSKLGIDVDKNFEPQYVIPRKSSKTVANLRKLADKSEKVILATDEDREGEAISWHLTKALKLENTPEKIERIVFHEITKNAIEQALKNPRQIDLAMVNAQQGRRVLDRLVGYKLSPFLWKKIFKGLSAGRVQSVALKLIVEREEEIEAFKATEYWQLEALLKKENDAQTIESRLVKINDKVLSQLDIKNKEEIDEILNELKNANFIITKKESKESRKNPLPPFTTSTLQQEAAKRLGFSAKKTMLMAQRLYENGFITYMRTDSVNLSQESLIAAKKWLTENLGAEYSADAPRTFKTKSRLAQEAHEAVRPTDMNMGQDNNSVTDASEKKLYTLIWQRFMASQMPQAIFETTQVDIQAKTDTQNTSRNFTFRVNGNILRFDGYLKIWKQKFEEKELPELKENEPLNLIELKPSQHFTEPPARYNEASLIKTLEEYGIGRPSTYAPTLSVIQERHYVEKQEGRLHPTDTGKLVNKVLKENFPEIVDVNFTAKMEESLDEIAENKIDWHEVIRNFYEPFAKNLEQKYIEAPSEKPPEEKTDVVCDKCGKPMVIKTGRFGRFLACSGFPECKNTKAIKPEVKKIGMACPKCKEGDVIEKRVTKGRARGKIFWGCSRYPKCDYASWTNPLEPQKEKSADADKETKE